MLHKIHGQAWHICHTVYRITLASATERQTNNKHRSAILHLRRKNIMKENNDDRSAFEVRLDGTADVGTITLLFSFRWELPSTSIFAFFPFFPRIYAGLCTTYGAWVLPSTAQYLQILFRPRLSTFYAGVVRAATWKDPQKRHKASVENVVLWKALLARYTWSSLVRRRVLFDVPSSLTSAARPAFVSGRGFGFSYTTVCGPRGQS